MKAKAIKRDSRAVAAAAISLLVVTVVLLTLAGGYAAAYDGDVDFSAPYLTVDPETGKLITVDPKAQPQQQTQHPAGGAGTARNAPDSGGAGPADAMPAQTAPAVQSEADAGTGSASALVYAIGGLLILIGITAAVRASRRRQVTPAGGSGDNV